MTPGYEIFISYRRESGSAEARLIQKELIEKGHPAFLDVTDLRSGLFDEALLAHIARTPNFVVILSPGALDRCAHPDDWLRREILQALDTGSNIVPVFLPGFVLPADLPEALRKLPRHQGVDYSHRYFDAMIEALVRACDPASTQKRRAIADLDAKPPAPQPVPSPVPKPVPHPVVDPPKPPSIPPHRNMAYAPAPPVPNPVKRSGGLAILLLSLGILALLVGVSYFAFFRASPPAPVASVEGTRWKEEGSSQFFDFLPGGVLEIHSGATSFNGHWELHGDVVNIDQAQSRYYLKVNVDVMGGTYRGAPNENARLERLDRLGPIPPHSAVAPKTAIAIEQSAPQPFVPGTTTPPVEHRGFRIGAVTSIEGTSWQAEGLPEFLEFLPDGVLNLRYTVDGKPTAGHWKQSGRSLTADASVDTYDLTVSGDEMTGTWRTMSSRSSPIKLHRLPTKPN